MALEEKLGVSVDEAARMIGISRARCYPLVMSGEIPSITIGSRRIIPVVALRAWMDAQLAAVGSGGAA